MGQQMDFLNGRIVTIGATQIGYSDNLGLTWLQSALPAVGTGWSGLSRLTALVSANKFVAVSSTPNWAYSTDGLTWLLCNTAGTQTSPAFIESPSTAVAFTGNQQIFYSTDAINWTGAGVNALSAANSGAYG
jgi:hypothetical protein